MKPSVLFYTALTAVTLLFSCKPHMTGDLRVFNDSAQIIYVKYSNTSSDTIIKRIDPGNEVILIILDGPGNSRDVECCPCQASIYSVYSSTGTIKKDPSVKYNWVIPNRNKLRKHGKEPVRCEFHVSDHDL